MLQAATDQQPLTNSHSGLVQKMPPLLPQMPPPLWSACLSCLWWSDQHPYPYPYPYAYPDLSGPEQQLS
jgi:hypothetical protein